MKKSMMKNQIKHIAEVSLFVLLILPFFVAEQANAAKVYFEPQPTSYRVGDEFTLSLFLDTENESINAVEINISIPELLKIRNISKNGSAIQLWVQEPSFSGKIINLLGGIPGGLTAPKLLIAKISLQATAIGGGNIVFMPGSSVLINDGQGTKLDLKTTGGPVFSVVPRPKKTPEEPSKTSEPEKEDNEDHKKPERFKIFIGEDPRVFNGQKFISFFTTDKNSGIDHYEIKEGSDDYKVAKSPYLLTDQELKTIIRVRAYDGAENFRENIYPNLFMRIWWQLLKIFWFN